jgi:hypothetical protein
MSYSKVQSSVVGNLPDIAKVKGRPRGRRSTPGQRSTPRSNQGRPRGQIKVDPEVKSRSTPRPASQDLRRWYRQQERTGKSTSTPLRPDRCTCTVPPRRLDPRSYAVSIGVIQKRRAAVGVAMPCMHSVGTNRPIRVLVLFRFVSFYCRCLRRHSSVDNSSVRGPRKVGHNGCCRWTFCCSVAAGPLDGRCQAPRTIREGGQRCEADFAPKVPAVVGPPLRHVTRTWNGFNPLDCRFWVRPFATT